MTAAELQQLKFNITGVQPFASDANAVLTAPKSQSSSYFCMPDGFGPAFGAVPEESGANQVTRGQLNYIGRLATQSAFLAKCGALGVTEFDPSVAASQTYSQYGVGGYPEGAVLTIITTDSTTGTKIQSKYLSLHDDNKYPLATTLTTTEESLYPDVAETESDSDGDWKLLSMKVEKASGQIEVMAIPSINAPRQSTGILGCFQAKYNGALIVSVGSDTTQSNRGLEMTDLTPTTSNEGGGGSTIVYDTTQMNFKIVVSAGKSSLSDLGGWVPCDLTNSNEANGTVIYSSGLIAESQLMMVEKDKWYGIGYGATFCSVESRDMWIKLVREEGV